jgi:hypothetical protein
MDPNHPKYDPDLFRWECPKCHMKRFVRHSRLGEDVINCHHGDHCHLELKRQSVFQSISTGEN